MGIYVLGFEEFSLSSKSLDDCSCFCTEWGVDVITNPNNPIPPPLNLQQKANLFKTRPPFDSLEGLPVDSEDIVKGDKRFKSETKSTSFETLWVLKRVVDRVCEVKTFTEEIFNAVHRDQLGDPALFSLHLQRNIPWRKDSGNYHLSSEGYLHKIDSEVNYSSS